MGSEIPWGGEERGRGRERKGGEGDETHWCQPSIKMGGMGDARVWEEGAKQSRIALPTDAFHNTDDTTPRV